MIFPKLKRIELVDSLEPTNESIGLFPEIWNRLWMYCAGQNISIDSDDWKFVYGRESINKQEDSSNCGIYAIMHMVAIMYHVNPICALIMFVKICEFICILFFQ